MDFSEKSLSCKKISDNVNSISTRSLRIRALIKLHKMEEAKQEARTLLKYKTDKTTYFRHIANSLKNVGLYDESLEYWKKLRFLEPDNIEDIKKLIQIYTLLHRIREALNLAKELVRRSNDPISSFKKLFEIIIKAGKVDYLKRLIKHFSYRLEKQALKPDFYIDILLASGDCYGAEAALHTYSHQLSERQQQNYRVRISLAQHNYNQAAALVSKQQPTNSLDEQEKIKRISDFQNTFCTRSPDLKNNFREHFIQNILAYTEDNPAFQYTAVKNSAAFVQNSFHLGGGTKQTLILARNLNKSTHENNRVNFCTYTRNPHESATFLKKLISGTHVNHVDAQTLPVTPEIKTLLEDPMLSALTPEIQKALRLHKLIQLLHTIKFLKPEVLYARGSTMLEASVAGAIMHVPRIIVHFGNVVEGWSTSQKDEDSKKLLAFIIQNLKEKSNFALAGNSQGTINSWSKYLNVDPSKFHLIYNTLDQETIELSPSKEMVQKIKKDYSIAEDVFVVGTVIRLEWVKNPKLWIKIAAAFVRRCPKAHFIIVGDGLMSEEIKHTVRLYGIEDKVTIAGPQREMLHHFYGAMDVFMLTSRSEGLSNVIPEAQLHGLPVIATNIASVREGFVVNKTGWLYDRNDISAFVNRLQWLFENPEAREFIKKEARETALKRFDNDKIIKSLRNAFEWS